MNWIKNRFDQLILAVVAVALLAFAAMVLTKTGSFEEQFSEAKEPVPPKPPGTSVCTLPGSEGGLPTILTSPPVWNVATNPDGSERGSLFWPGRYLPTKDGPMKPEDAPPIRGDSLTGKWIPNMWFINHELPLEQGTVTLQDPDKDGFTNEDEWRAGTDPRDSNSHPPYYTKLFLKQVIRTPFHLMFATYNGDIKKTEALEFQINTVELRLPSKFLKIGEMVPNTKLKLEKFEPKEVWNEKIGEKEDVSELTLRNTETDGRVVLVHNRLKNAPSEEVVLAYQWPPAAGDIRVRRVQQFGLRPETDKNKLYKLIDIRESEAVIQTPDGLDYTVVRDPRQTAR